MCPLKIAVVGDSVLDLECFGQFNGNLVENPQVPLFRGGRPHVHAGGAANVATILSHQKHTVDLYTSGPGPRHEAWIVDLLKKTTKANRIVFSNQGSIPLKMRGIGPDGKVAARIDGEEYVPYKGSFVALDGLLDDVRRGTYDAVIVSDYCKGLVCEHTEQVIVDILRSANCSVVDSKRKGDYSLWSHATAVTPNLSEADSIYGTSDPCEIQRVVGCKVVYVTRGKEAVLMGCSDGMTEISVSEDIAHPYIVGAGDAFCAGVTLSLAQGRSYLAAGMAGVKLAQAYVGKPRKSPLK
jgi:D-beta-D-heptose 7-phosphate kinase/D-beta-D-heptose 1-phosphate adenosyltransferase